MKSFPLCSWILVFLGLAPIVAAQQPEPAPNEVPSNSIPKEEQGSAPKYETLSIPTAEVLLAEPPVDWVVLINSDTHFVEPVQPRPDTVAKMQAAHEASLQWPKPPNEADAREQQRRRTQLLKLPITLLAPDIDPEYQVDIKYVQKIVHYEDLILQRVDERIAAADTATAYRLLRVIEERDPNWPGAEDRRRALISLEADLALRNGHPEDALRWLEVLAERDREYRNLKERAGTVADSLIAAAVAENDFRRARHFLARLSTIFQGHPIAEQWTSRLLERTRALLDDASRATESGDWRAAADLVFRASRIWPATPGLTERLRAAGNRWPVLRVGVVDHPAAGQDSDRWARLREVRLFEPVAFADGRLRYRSRVVAHWEPLDLGRRLDLRLRASPASWESREPLTALDVATTIRSAANGSTAEDSISEQLRDGRISEVVSSVEVSAVDSVSIRFRRAPFRPEVMLGLPVVDRTGTRISQSWQASTALSGQPAFVRTVPESPADGNRHVAEVIEISYPETDELLQGLTRGDIDMAATPAWKDLSRLEEDSRYYRVQLAVPAVHVVVFHPESVPLANTLLRKSLQMSVPRGEVLRDVLLADANPAYGRLVSGPLPSQHAAYHRVLEMPTYDPLVAAALALTAKKELGEAWRPLRLEVPHDPRLRGVFKQLQGNWKRVGIDVTLTETGAEGGPPDISYRVLRTWEPLVDFARLLTFDHSVSPAGLSRLPEALRTPLRQLELDADWAGAVRTLQFIQEAALADARYLPLWEVDEFLVVRRNVFNMRNPPLWTYDSVEQWLIRPWYPTETP
jgi:hypothetical protein